MLKELRIQNIILVDSADIQFGEGFNVISGETGSGKSAIMGALSLVMGSRADSGLVRSDCSKGTVEALFNIKTHETLKHLLDESGIEVDEELIIRREISANGKNRSWINHQMVQLNLLRQVGEQLADMVGQHANQRLMSIEHHREIIDLFGDLQEEQNQFSMNWSQENQIQHELEHLQSRESQRLREMEVCRMEIEELESAALKEDEEEELFAEYTRLTNSEELAQQLNQVNQALSSLSVLSQQKGILDKLAELDPNLEDTSEAYSNALLELQEISNTLIQYQSRIEHNPTRIEEVNRRLTQINKLKRKYGTTVSEIQAYLEESKQKLYELEHHDEKIEECQKKLDQLRKQNDKLSHKLTHQRQEVASSLEKQIIQELRKLNMPKVEFEAQFTKQKRSSHGDDRIEFYLRPNVGEALIPIRECASGGELSRLLLALQTVLTGKEKTPTLIFDEVDANIGGETAVAVGQKLQKIGKKHQVLCITHFPQVAKQGDHHLQISKVEKEGRTVTLIRNLSDIERKQEIKRMLGEN